MRFFTQQECEEWLQGRQRSKPDTLPSLHRVRLAYPVKAAQFRFFAHWIATSLGYGQPVLLWILDWGVWPSSENWHMYYVLRQRYGDPRLLHEAPGHFFLAHETEDLASFLQLAMLNGWDGYLLTQADHANALFSHDEFVDFFSEQEEQLSDIRRDLEGTSEAATE